MFKFDSTNVGDFVINVAKCSVGDSQTVEITENLNLENVPSVNCVTSGRFSFGPTIDEKTIEFNVGTQTYDHPERFVGITSASITALDEGSTFVCLSPRPIGSHFNHARRNLESGESISLQQGHLLYVITGRVSVSGKIVEGPKAIYAKTGDLTLSALEKVDSVELWK